MVKQLFILIVRPQLEYNTEILIDMELIEKVQQRATKLLFETSTRFSI